MATASKWRQVGGAGLLLGLVAGAAFFQDRWVPRLYQLANSPDRGEHDHEHAGREHDDHGPATETGTPKTLELSPQARQNLGLVARPVRPQTYWRTILVPGEIVDRPGFSDRGVTAPAVAVVTQIHAFPGDTVRPGDRLFTLRLVSEYIQNSQSELFKATREVQLVQEQRDRLAKAAESGSVPAARLLELDQQLRRFQATVQAYRQDLLTRGLRPEQLAEVIEGRFVASIEVVAPPAGATATATTPTSTTPAAPAASQEAGTDATSEMDSVTFEIQELKAELGMQVQAGQALAVLSNHRQLFIAGHAFKRESPYLERATQRKWPIEVEFAEDEPSAWPALEQTFAIRHLANSIDSESRTFAFFIPLSNQSRTYDREGERFVVWRFRPGQRVRLHVPVEELKDVFVLPTGAVVREGPEAFVFRQNGDLFDRKPVRVLHEDRRHIIVAHDGSIAAGWYIAQGSAASLNRVLKAQSQSGGLPPGFHVHADGSVHGAH